EIGVTVEHSIVSSGIKEILEGTSIARAGNFKRIYACEFMYDENGSIRWPKVAVNYTAKTQFLFRINKGVLDIDSKSASLLNEYTPENARRVPFGNMIYVGDGITDVPCMRLVKAYGGQSIAVYNEKKGDNTAKRLLSSGRVNYCVPADFTAGSLIEKIVCTVMKKIKAVSDMESF
ncbi:MAG: haloacid dehalogenase-like hydrolase, partial [Clostridia bacterium]|nr:haloacid dehalogenase-like hydrolase [Clostridia bacterium]